MTVTIDRPAAALATVETPLRDARTAAERIRDNAWADPALNRKLLLYTLALLARYGMRSERVAAVVLWLALTAAVASVVVAGGWFLL